MKAARAVPARPARLVLDYDGYGATVAALRALKGAQGVALVRLVRVQSVGTTEEFLLAAASAGDQVLDAELTEKLLSLPGRAQPLDGTADVGAVVQAAVSAQRTQVIANIERRNLTLFTDETEKLDAWADDLKLGLEREIKELDRRIKETRTKSKGAATLAEKLEAQKEQRNLEALPKEIRDRLNLDAGSILDFQIQPDNTITARHVRPDARRIRGSLKSPQAPPLTVEQVDEAVSKHLRDKHAHRQAGRKSAG